MDWRHTYILRGDSLLRAVIAGKMEGKKRRVRPGQMILDLMIADGYGKPKEETQQREEWRRRKLEPAYEAEKRKKKTIMTITNQSPLFITVPNQTHTIKTITNQTSAIMTVTNHAPTLQS